MRNIDRARQELERFSTIFLSECNVLKEPSEKTFLKYEKLEKKVFKLFPKIQFEHKIALKKGIKRLFN